MKPDVRIDASIPFFLNLLNKSFLHHCADSVKFIEQTERNINVTSIGAIKRRI